MDLQVTAPTGACFYAAPSTKSPCMAVLPKGTRLVEVGRPANFFRNVVFMGHVGYVADPFTKPIDAGQVAAALALNVEQLRMKTAYITGDGVRLRSSPQVNNNVILSMNRGEPVQIVGKEQNGFALVVYSGKNLPFGATTADGWVSKQYLAVDQLPPQVAIVPVPEGPNVTPQPPPEPPPDIEKASLVEEKVLTGPAIAVGLLLLAVVIYFIAK